MAATICYPLSSREDVRVVAVAAIVDRTTTATAATAAAVDGMGGIGRQQRRRVEQRVVSWLRRQLAGGEHPLARETVHHCDLVPAAAAAAAGVGARQGQGLNETVPVDNQSLAVSDKVETR